ncbi:MULTISPECIES: sulfite exporter TauE/SafE family protein [unclassified Moritella]|uniref:sulfite exporter TauE/SafE family protein n=1 Tax=unclassified Moritella TaxID=2637987 RepID=UPI001BADEF04|nr:MULTISPECIES: sulfite exporter TauE/SafE family protein [unclassified Moritella]QUM85059.1 sulfite exporter TauE/SafE family protein [Moritella sp. 28]QUM89292.1 sulfite exporter TauE/SafE family protein [Moritella sp. 36]
MITSFFAAFMIGILGAGHCIAMCGGISGAIAHANTQSSPQTASLAPLFYNLGRISSYTLIGLIVGYTAQIGLNFGAGYDLLVILRFVSGITLILIGLYIAQLNSAILQLEKVGRLVWRYIQPLARQFLPLKTPYHAFPLGFLWGWLPCGLVYSALTLALSSGSALESALTMFSFGLGTFPIMFLVGSLSSKFNSLIQNAKFKKMSGLLLVLFGLHIIYIALVQLSASGI